MADEEPRIIVDSDWKREAQEEKDRLAAEVEQAMQQAELPDATFLELVNMIVMQAMISLGGMQMPDGKQIPQDLMAAKHHIDLLEIMQQKTKGNLDDQEQKVLDSTLHELRMGFVQASTSAGSADPTQSPE